MPPTTPRACRSPTATCGWVGAFEPAEGGFRIVRARIAHGERGFTVRAAETILVSAPK